MNTSWREDAWRLSQAREAAEDARKAADLARAREYRVSRRAGELPTLASAIANLYLESLGGGPLPKDVTAEDIAKQVVLAHRVCKTMANDPALGATKRHAALRALIGLVALEGGSPQDLYTESDHDYGMLCLVAHRSGVVPRPRRLLADAVGFDDLVELSRRVAEGVAIEDLAVLLATFKPRFHPVTNDPTPGRNPQRWVLALNEDGKSLALLADNQPPSIALVDRRWQGSRLTIAGGAARILVAAAARSWPRQKRRVRSADRSVARHAIEDGTGGRVTLTNRGEYRFEGAEVGVEANLLKAMGYTT